MEHLLQQSLFKAGPLDEKRPFQNLYELDLSLWSIFQQSAKSNKKFTAKCLEISEGTSYELGCAPHAKLRKLASGVFLSFSLDSNSPTLLKNIASVLAKYDEHLPELLLSNSKSAKSMAVIKAKQYWRVMRDLALFNGINRAALAFNVTYEVAEKISKFSDAQLLNLALNTKTRFILRFSDSTLLELLKREHTTHHSLLRYQQILSSNERSALSKKDTFDSSPCSALHDPELEGLEEQPKMSSFKSYSAPWVKAKHLAVLGFATRVMAIELGVSPKQVIRVKKELNEEGAELPTTATKLRNGKLICDYTTSIQASILMMAYSRYGGEDIHKNIDINALGSALMLFYKMRHEAEMNDLRWKPIDSNAGYSLARELRGSGEKTKAYFEECSSCKTTIFTSTNQQVRHAERCPFCRTKDAKKINAI